METTNKFEGEHVPLIKPSGNSFQFSEVSEHSMPADRVP